MATNSILGNGTIDVDEPPVNLVSCTAATDGWIVNTNNTSGKIDVFITNSVIFTPAVPSKVSPKFASENTIDSNVDWVSNGWVATAGSTFGAPYFPFTAFVKNVRTNWFSAQNEFFATTGLPQGGDGGVFLQMEFPEAVPLLSFSIRAPGDPTLFVVPRKWDLLGSNDGTTFTFIQTYVKLNNEWTLGGIHNFTVTYNDTPYKYWRFFFTEKTTLVSQSYVGFSELELTTKRVIGLSPTVMNNIIPVNTASFKIQVVDTTFNVINLTTSPYTGAFNMIVIKNDAIVNHGSYRFTPGGIVVL